jgi:hypothetical protein
MLHREIGKHLLAIRMDVKLFSAQSTNIYLIVWASTTDNRKKS